MSNAIPCSIRFLSTILVAILATASAASGQPRRMAAPPVQLEFPASTDVVEVPFELDMNKVVIPVSVNGSGPLKFVLDTGAPVAVLIDSSAAGDLALTIMGEARVGGMGSSEPRSLPLASDVHFDIGGVKLTGLMVIDSDGQLSTSDWDGVIGGPLFARLVVDIDWEKQLVRFYQPDRFNYTGSGATIDVELEPQRGIPIIPAKVASNGGEPVDMSLIVDVGAGHALSLEPDALKLIEKPEKTVETVLGWGASGELHGQIGRITSLEIGGYRMTGVVTSFPDAEYLPDGLRTTEERGYVRHGNLGVGVLKRFRTIIDITDRRIILEPYPTLGNEFPFSTVGIRLAPERPGEEFLGIADVIAGSPADSAGIATTDRIISINGERTASIGRDAADDLLSQREGTLIRLVIERDGAPLEVDMTAKRLL